MLILIDRKSIKNNPDYMKNHVVYDSGCSSITIKLAIEFNQDFINKSKCNRHFEKYSFGINQEIMNIEYIYSGERKRIDELSSEVFNLFKNSFIKNSFTKFSFFEKVQHLFTDLEIMKITVCGECINEMRVNNDIRIIPTLPDTRKYLYQYKNMSMDCPKCSKKIKSDDLVYDYIETSEFYSSFYKCPLCESIIDNIEYEDINKLTGMEAGLSC